MTPEQRKVILDYATELQSNDEPWREFECAYSNCVWTYCGEDINPIQQASNPAWRFRRRPKTITVTMPVPIDLHSYPGGCCLNIQFASTAVREEALAAIQEAMQEKGE